MRETVSRPVTGKIILVVAAMFFAGTPAGAQEGFDCAKTCEDGTREALEKCRANHPADSGDCPSDDGHIADNCRKTCAELGDKSPDELIKMLPPDYKDVLEGK